MQKILSKLSIFAGLAVFALTLAVPATTNAETGAQTEADQPVKAQTDQQKAEMMRKQEAARAAATQKMEQNKEKTVEKRVEVKTKLDDNKLKTCQNREKSINNIMSNIAQRGTKQLDVFTKISDRTQAFYKDKGLSVTNYDELVADVNAKKTAAEATVAQVKTTSLTFKCDGTDPKGASASFKTSLEAEKSALKAYKTAIKNLIKAIKSANDTLTEGTQQ